MSVVPNIFYHIGALNHWQDVVDEQLSAFAATPLVSCPLWIGVSGGNRDVVDWIMRRAANLNVVEMSTHKHLDAYELPTLRMLERRSKEVPGVTPFLYFHTKGLKDGRSVHKDNWRYLMMREVILKSGDCIKALLDGYDAVGVDWRSMRSHGGDISHFSGNFWWARASYLAQLMSLDAYYSAPRYPEGWSEGRRLGCEFWISSGKTRPRVKSLVCENVDLVVPSEVERVLHG